MWLMLIATAATMCGCASASAAKSPERGPSRRSARDQPQRQGGDVVGLRAGGGEIAYRPHRLADHARERRVGETAQPLLEPLFAEERIVGRHRFGDSVGEQIERFARREAQLAGLVFPGGIDAERDALGTNGRRDPAGAEAVGRIVAGVAE